MGTYLISCDWGTSSFRLQLLDLSSGEMISKLSTRDGISELDLTYSALDTSVRTSRDAYLLEFLQHQLGCLSAESGMNLQGIPVIISGMASSTLGILELPYAKMPFKLDGSDIVWQQLPRSATGSNDIYLISGLCSGDDVMRGEETEIVGICKLLSEQGALPAQALFVMPGTHSKHVAIADGYIRSSSTFLTGELFGLLTKYSVLRKSTITDHADGFEACLSSFIMGVEVSGSGGMASNLFQVRTRQILKGLDALSNTYFLSGLLIGSELHAIGDHLPVIYLCAGGSHLKPYLQAFQVLGLEQKLVVLPSEIMENACGTAHRYILNDHLTS